MEGTLSWWCVLWNEGVLMPVKEPGGGVNAYTWDMKEWKAR